MTDISIIKKLSIVIHNSRPKNNDGKLLDDFRTSHPDFLGVGNFFYICDDIAKIRLKIIDVGSCGSNLEFYVRRESEVNAFYVYHVLEDEVTIVRPDKEEPDFLFVIKNFDNEKAVKKITIAKLLKTKEKDKSKNIYDDGARFLYEEIKNITPWFYKLKLVPIVYPYLQKLLTKKYYKESRFDRFCRMNQYLL